MSKSKEIQKLETQNQLSDFVQHINSFLQEKGIKLQVKNLTLDNKSVRPCTKKCGRNKHCVWTLNTGTGDMIMECADD